MQNKYRSFPPAVPLKMTKLLQYDYLNAIYRKYDSCFFRQILPYFSEILVTNKLELLKFVYFPTDNPIKLKNLVIGEPFRPESDTKTQAIYELPNQITFIKLDLQTHAIFEYLMSINLACIPLIRLKFQDKFWLFSEGKLKNFSFGDVVFRKDSRRERGILIFLEGEYTCLNQEKKPFKTIGKGYLIDINGNLKKIKYDEKMKTDRICFDDSVLGSANRESQAETFKEKETEHKVSTIWSHSNSAKGLFISYAVIKKYCPTYQDPSMKTPPLSKMMPVKANKQPFKPEFRSNMSVLGKYQRLQTELHESPALSNGRRTYASQMDTPQKKFNLVSMRIESPQLNRPTLAPQEYFENDIIKSYAKERQLYQNMRKQLEMRRHKKFHSSGEIIDPPLDKKQHLMPFFKQELKDQKEKVILRRRKTKELWAESSPEKQNFVTNARKSIQAMGKSQPFSKSSLKQSKLIKTIGKNELSAFQLLKRNLYNKEYHRLDFVQMHS